MHGAQRNQTPDEQRAIMHADFERRLTYHPPSAEQAALYAQITQLTKELGHAIIDMCPPSAELQLALRALEEARMRANQSIAVNEQAR